jgi:hypothetical protein
VIAAVMRKSKQATGYCVARLNLVISSAITGILIPVITLLKPPNNKPEIMPRRRLSMIYLS